jgi:hypothetical protein
VILAEQRVEAFRFLPLNVAIFENLVETTMVSPPVLSAKTHVLDDDVVLIQATRNRDVTCAPQKLAWTAKPHM